MAEEQKSKVSIILKPQSVIAPTIAVLKDTLEVIIVAINAIEREDLSRPPRLENAALRFEFGVDSISGEERARNYTNWLLSKGFNELAKGIRLSLEQAFLFVGILKEKPKTVGEFKKLERELNAAAHGANFPDLMKMVSVELTAPLSFENEYRSLQRVRNCLEHRNGIVGKRDCPDGKSSLVLSLPRLKVYFKKDGKEIELEAGVHLEKGASVMQKWITHEKKYDVGDRISFSVDEFYRIGMGCWVFAQDLGGKLPKAESKANPSGVSADSNDGGMRFATRP